MTPSPLAARVHALIAQWRSDAEQERAITYKHHGTQMYAHGQTWALLKCAEDLEAALAAALAPKLEKEPTT